MIHSDKSWQRKPLLPIVTDAANTWSIWQLFPTAKRQKQADLKRSTALGFALCNLAIELGQGDREAHYLFLAGASVLNVSRSKRTLEKYVALHEDEVVKANPEWTWEVNKILLHYPETASKYFLESLGLNLNDGLMRRDATIVGLLNGEIPEFPIGKKCLKEVARRVMSGEVKFRLKKYLQRATKAAKKWA